MTAYLCFDVAFNSKTPLTNDWNIGTVWHRTSRRYGAHPDWELCLAKGHEWLRTLSHRLSCHQEMPCGTSIDNGRSNRRFSVLTPPPPSMSSHLSPIPINEDVYDSSSSGDEPVVPRPPCFDDDSDREDRQSKCPYHEHRKICRTPDCRTCRVLCEKASSQGSPLAR